MSYEHDLAFNLRLRGIPEPQIAEAVEEVRVHTHSTGQSAEDEFGSTDEYAQTFPQQKTHTRGRRAVLAGKILAIAYVVCAFAAQPLAGIDVRDIVGPVMLWPALAILGISILGGFLLDYLRPAPRAATR